jgi:hypothetical protein
VLASVQEDAKAVGSSEKDKAEVEAWIEKVAAGEVTAESLKVCTLRASSHQGPTLLATPSLPQTQHCMVHSTLSLYVPHNHVFIAY